MSFTGFVVEDGSITSSVSWTYNSSEFLQDPRVFWENKEWLSTFRCFLFLFVVVVSV